MMASGNNVSIWIFNFKCQKQIFLTNPYPNHLTISQTPLDGCSCSRDRYQSWTSYRRYGTRMGAVLGGDLWKSILFYLFIYCNCWSDFKIWISVAAIDKEYSAAFREGLLIIALVIYRYDQPCWQLSLYLYNQPTRQLSLYQMRLFMAT